MIKESIDAKDDKTRALLNDPANQIFSEPNVSVTLLEIHSLLERLEGVLVWAESSMGSQQESQQAFKAGSEKRLADLRKEVADAKKFVADQENAIKKLQAQIDSMKAQSLDSTQAEKELASAKKDLEEKNQVILSAPDREKDLNNAFEI